MRNETMAHIIGNYTSEDWHYALEERLGPTGLRSRSFMSYSRSPLPGSVKLPTALATSISFEGPHYNAGEVHRLFADALIQWARQQIIEENDQLVSGVLKQGPHQGSHAHEEFRHRVAKRGAVIMNPGDHDLLDELQEAHGRPDAYDHIGKCQVVFDNRVVEGTLITVSENAVQLHVSEIIDRELRPLLQADFPDAVGVAMAVRMEMLLRPSTVEYWSFSKAKEPDSEISAAASPPLDRDRLPPNFSQHPRLETQRISGFDWSPWVD